MTISLLLSALVLVPQPQKVVERGGVTDRVAVSQKTDPTILPEGYRLSVTTNGVMIACSDAAGAFYAQETLKQLTTVDDKGGQQLPLVEIEDAPRYRWRGVHIDDCRHFFGKETLLGVLDLMAAHKLNRLHWHLTDDQGWRLDIPGCPELVKYGAVRPASVRHGETEATNGQPYGPFYYTERDVREIIAYAAARHIQIVPEIELPGHVYAALAAYPAFACFPEHLAKRTPRVQWGVEKDVLCIGNDEAIKFMEKVLDYVCQIFPSDIVHIGGDECPSEMWKSCPKCQARIAGEGLKDEHSLHPWITRHFAEFLAKRGRRVIGWDDIVIGDVPKNVIAMCWHDQRLPGDRFLLAGEIAAKGYDVVQTPGWACYFDYPQGRLKDDPYQYLGGGDILGPTLERVYTFDPCANVPESARRHVLGAQCNNWSEYTWNEYDLAWKMWPRTCALAEVLWTGEARPGYADFKRRMTVHRSRLIAHHVNCAPLE